MMLEKISIIITLLLNFQNQNMFCDPRSSGPVPELHCKNSFNNLDNTQ